MRWFIETPAVGLDLALDVRGIPVPAPRMDGATGVPRICLAVGRTPETFREVRLAYPRANEPRAPGPNQGAGATRFRMR
jgi:hypothetical protein